MQQQFFSPFFEFDQFLLIDGGVGVEAIEERVQVYFERFELMTFMLVQAAQRADQAVVLAFLIEANKVELLRLVGWLAAFHVFDNEGGRLLLHSLLKCYYY